MTFDKSSNDSGEATTVGTVIDTPMTSVERFHHGPPVCHSSSSRLDKPFQIDVARPDNASGTGLGNCRLPNEKETDYMHG
jgi:hypothetical protein